MYDFGSVCGAPSGVGWKPSHCIGVGVLRNACGYHGRRTTFVSALEQNRLRQMGAHSEFGRERGKEIDSERVYMSA